MKGMLTCKDASQLASKALETPLPWRERWGLRLHLLFCKLCRRYVRELRFLRSAFRWRHDRASAENITPTRIRLSLTARKRIRAALAANQER